MSDAADRLSAALADRYRIERELGAGGMATVYLAHDLKHDRKVAIKVLKPELAAVLGAERFVQEIKTTAALSHPHILPLFDSGTADAQLYYVMPYIQGETLREKLNRETQLGVDESVRIATEVADALDYAHRHGVIHRDIKPENILLHDGRPMVMDFGIALAVSAAAGGRMTETGLSLGTPHYMSPEQATADKEITGRSDIYSLATVLYEMLAGEPPHTGNSAQQIIMKIVTEDAAPVTKLRKSVPPNIAAALAKALEKLPADRFENAKAFADALGDPHFSTGATEVIGAPSRASMRTIARSPVAIGLTAALIAVGVFALAQWRFAHDIVRPVVRFKMSMPSTMLVTNSAEATNVAVSPDGNTIAYALPDSTGTAHLYLRPVGALDARMVTGTDGAQQPCFSPDGQWVAYIANASVRKIQVTGGSPMVIGSAGVSPTGTAWSPTGVILLGTEQGLMSLPASGGSPTILVKPDPAREELYFNQPRVMADGKTVLFSIQPTGGLAGIHLGEFTLGSGTVKRLGLNLMDVIGYVDGTLVYALTSGALMAVPFDYRNGQTTGNAVALGPSVTPMIAVAASMAAMSPTGTLVYQPADAEGVLGWADMLGAFTPLISQPQAYGYPRLSPDGKRIAVSIGSPGQTDVWVYDIASATLTRLTSGGAQNDRPEWTPDNRRVLYRTDRGARTAIWWQPADLSEPAAPLLASEYHYYEAVITPDGKNIVYQVDDAGADQADVMYRALEGDTTSHPIAASRFVEAQARISPDGKWVAYVTDASGTSQVVVQPFPGPGGVVQVSVGGGTEPVWSRDGHRIFYRDGRYVVAASVLTTGAFAVTGRTSVIRDNYVFATAPHANYDVSPDGTRLLMIRGKATPEYDVVYGFGTELRARMHARAGM